VAVDKAGRRHRAACIDCPPGGIGLRYRRGFVAHDKLSAIHRDRHIADDTAARWIDSDEPVDIVVNQINGLHVILGYLFSPT
jgi:hypothetical protein